MLRVAGVEPNTEVEGPGLRFALWLQGCSRHCPGCCNPHMQDPYCGMAMSPADLAHDILTAECDGLTIVGGEPLEQIAGLKSLFDSLEALKYSGNIMVFTGFTIDEIRVDPEKIGLVSRADVVIAGPFLLDQTPDRRKWIGSRNQTVHFFRNRLDFLRENWPGQSKEIEIHIGDDEFSINGFPVGEENEFEQIFAHFEKRRT
jgi:anaerobic ribonucleoside-triphosphate reductase activating protein